MKTVEVAKLHVVCGVYMQSCVNLRSHTYMHEYRNRTGLLSQTVDGEGFRIVGHVVITVLFTEMV